MTISSTIATGRKKINLDALLCKRSHPIKGHNSCTCVSLAQPQNDHFAALVNGMSSILPFMYRSEDDLFHDLLRYGMDFTKSVPIPSSFDFQWAHAGEILACAYFEECENAVILTYKWRLNTTRNQHQYGMDLLAFDFDSSPVKIYAIAVKTTTQGEKGKTPSVVYGAINELKDYIESEKLDNDLIVTSANLHVNEATRQAFEDWYNPYVQKVPNFMPELILTPTIIIDEENWDDDYALPAINKDFGRSGAVRIIQVKGLTHLVEQTYAEATR